jgi:hypothetical protein
LAETVYQRNNQAAKEKGVLVEETEKPDKGF